MIRSRSTCYPSQPCPKPSPDHLSKHINTNTWVKSWRQTKPPLRSHQASTSSWRATLGIVTRNSRYVRLMYWCLVVILDLTSLGYFLVDVDASFQPGSMLWYSLESYLRIPSQRHDRTSLLPLKSICFILTLTRGASQQSSVPTHHLLNLKT